MTSTNRHVKRWAFAAVMVGGVATGLVTAAGATSATTALHESPMAAQVQQVHREVVALTEKEEGLSTELLQREQQNRLAAELAAATASSQAVTVTPVAPQQAQQSASTIAGSGTRSPLSSPGKPVGTTPTATSTPGPPAYATPGVPESTTTTVSPISPVTPTTLAADGTDGGD